MKYIENISLNPYYNLALEEYVLRNCKDDDYVLLWQNDNTIVFGVNQNPLEEINMKLAEAKGINIVRRSTGGGTVYHDLGNLNFSYITNWEEESCSKYTKFLQPLVDAFRTKALEIEIKGRNDMLLEGKKISGSAQRLLNGRILHHGTLLIDSNLEKLSEVLRVSRDKVKSKGIKSVRSRVANINDHINPGMAIDEVRTLLLKQWFGDEIEQVTLNETQLSNIQKQAEKYKSWDWNYARSPKYIYRNKKRFDGGIIDINLDIDAGVIRSCMINGDFLSLKSITEVEEAIVGIRYDIRAVAHALGPLQLELYFGDITKEEVLSCFQ